MSSLFSFIKSGTARDITVSSKCYHQSNDEYPNNPPVKIGMFTIVPPNTWEVTTAQRNILTQVSHVIETDETFMNSTLIPLVTQEMGISLRALDWLVTNFSKKYHLCINGYDVHCGYKDTLSNFRRRNFDPFCRHIDAEHIGEIQFTHKGTVYNTTVGQVNFLLWAHRHRIIEYIENNINTIENDMRISLDSGCGDPNLQGKRKELSASPGFKCTITSDSVKSGSIYSSHGGREGRGRLRNSGSIVTDTL
mgnify:CR=1 FL=1